jgi:cell division protein ZipA
LASELRWILAALSLALLIGIWLWGSRRSRQAPGNPELREVTAGTAAAEHPAPPAEEEPRRPEPHAAPRERGVGPLEPLQIRTTDFEPVQAEPLSMSAQAEPAAPGTVHPEMRAADAPTVTSPLPSDAVIAAAKTLPVRSPVAPPPPQAPPAVADAAATGTHAEAPNSSHTQRIITIRVGAGGDSRWRGDALLAALEKQGMAFGRYQVFHRRHSDGRTVFCAASLIEPGTFDLSEMARQEFRGVTLFAVLPGPVEPLETLNELIATAGRLADALSGVVQDSTGRAMTQRQAEAIREDMAHFQAMLRAS